MNSQRIGGFRLVLPLLLLTTLAAPAVLVVSPTNQQFTGRPDNTYTPQDVLVSNSSPSDINWTRTITYSSGGSGWLTWLPASFPGMPSGYANQFPSEINAAGLTAGVYVATNTFDAGADGTSRVVVTLSVSNFPAVTVTPNSISYTVALGSAVTVFKTIIVSNSGDGDCHYWTLTNRYDASGATNWLALQPGGGFLADSGANIHTVQVINAGAAFSLPGLYFATNEIGRDGGVFDQYALITNAPLYLTVSVLVTGTPPTALQVAPGNQAFRGRPDTNYVPQAFVLSNTGAVPLTWTSTVSYGAGAADWLLFAPTSAALGAGASQTWTSRVDATGLTGGVYVATNRFQAGSFHAADLVATLTVSTNYASLVVSPGSLTFNGTFGQDIAAAQTILVSNNGFGPCSYTLQTNAYDASGANGWLSVTPATASLNDSGTQIHTVRIQNAASVFSNIGTFYATNEIGLAGGIPIANTPLFLPVAVNISGLPAPTGVTATNDGNEFLRLGWTAAPGYSNLVVWREGAPPDADPVAGSNYTAGVSSLGNGLVIYRGPSFQGFEMMVKTNVVNYFKVYHITNNTYSPATPVAATTGVYRAGLIYEPFSLLNGLAVHAATNRGNGWAGSSWSSGSAPYAVIQTNYGDASTPLFPSFGNAGTNRGNRLTLDASVNNTNRSTYRALPPATSGTLYVSAILAVQYGGGGKYTGVRLYSNTTERVFLGELGGPHDTFGVNAGSGDLTTGYNIYPYGAGPTNANTGNVYTVVLRYNFANKEIKGKAYYRTQAIDLAEPGAWDASGTAASVVTYLDGLDVVSGGFATDVPNQPGRAFFDEVRVATTWTGLWAGAELPFSGGGGDQDGDGIPDAWESLYFGGPTNASPLANGDGDDFLNLEEYLADTVPTNGNSFFRRATNLTGAAVWTVTLQESSTGRVYDLYWKTNLLDTNAWQPAGLSVTGVGGALNLVVTNLAPETFRRTGVRLP